MDNALSRILKYIAIVFQVIFAMPCFSQTSTQPSPLITGIASHFGQAEVDPAIYLPRLKAAGWQAVRDEFYWSHVEDDQGNFTLPQHLKQFINAAQSTNIKVLVVLGYGHPKHTLSKKPITEIERNRYLAYVDFIVRQTREIALAFEVWNEWDIAIGGGAPGHAQDYMRLLQDTIPVIRRHSNLPIIGGSATPEGVDRRQYLEQLVQRDLLKMVDGLSIHPYVWSKRFRNSPNDLFQWVNNIAKKYPNTKLWITETGWPTHDNKKIVGLSRRTTPERQAQYLCESLKLTAQIKNVSAFFWYTLKDKDAVDDPEHNFGLIDNRGNPKPGFDLSRCADRVVPTTPVQPQL